MVSMDELIGEFVCKVCYGYMRPPIKMCENGHCHCIFCYNRVPSCPECRGKKIETRNIQLEELFGILSFPCSNAENGCSVVAKGPELIRHEYTCRYDGGTYEDQTDEDRPNEDGSDEDEPEETEQDGDGTNEDSGNEDGTDSWRMVDDFCKSWILKIPGECYLHKR